MDEVQAFECVILLDAAEEMHTALFTCITLNGSAAVEYVKFVSIGGDRHIVTGNHTNNTENGAGRSPALGAAAGVVVQDVRAELNLDRLRTAVAAESATVEIGRAFLKTAIEKRV